MKKSTIDNAETAMDEQEKNGLAPDQPDSLEERGSSIPNSQEEENRLASEFVRQIVSLIEEGDNQAVYDMVAPLHPADIAELFAQAPVEIRRPLAAAITDLMSGEVISEMNEWVREDLLKSLTGQEVANIIAQLDLDDAVVIVSELDAQKQQETLQALSSEDRAAIERALSFPLESAGRMMQRNLVAVHENMSVGDVIHYLRQNDDLTTDFWEVFVVDPSHRPIGTCKLSKLLRMPRHALIQDIMQPEQTLIPVTMDQEEVALRFQKYGLISAAVVDESGRLVGMITVDDIIHIIRDEADEDILKLSGAGDGDINEPVLDSYKSRVRWLITNLGTALVASTIIGFFEGTIARMVELATLMPIVAGVGGNAGSQTMAVTVRALATNQLTASNCVRSVTRELRIALLNGLTVACVLGAGTWLVFHNVLLTEVIALAIMSNIIIGGLAGVLVPLTFDRAGSDPAVASSIFVTMTTDAMGFLTFLGLATVSGLTGA
ncbi:magnesium transporter [Zymomonas mobilis]|uniref:magnesium transporter n=1 Tax=Zymomonas mobilis TaxID=542 RepID=UPI00026D80E9|nr:magnesium transporter [Zymomonas mobilis]AFN56418.1 magnesium transporter [Zymomonas mobilis subsp. mobilis ATCC 29191]TQK78151.1 magnesium transporter [Zymomonas mobilis]TQL15203.1 magnesium transporter [Zymomonas mobilis]GEB87380.1 magnesium transporter MgtE [Zymomonas mobilis subsp. mobilis]